MKSTNQTQNLNVVYVDVSTLRPATYNPRRWDESAMQHLTESIKRFGMVDPLIANSTKERFNVLIGGHFRLKVAKDLGFKQVPVVYINIPDIEKEKELNLRLNRNTGEWDLELLKKLDVEMLLDVGFNDSDLAAIWDENLGVEDDDFDTDKELAEIKTPTTKIGDFLKLGNHYLLCGDATNPKVVEKLVGAEKISTIYCDPPYNISLDYNNGLGTKRKYGGKTQDNKSDEEYKEFLKITIENALAVSQPNCHIFYYCDESYIGLMQSIYKEVGVDNKRVCLWVKNSQNPTPQVAFSKCYEPVIYGTRGTPYLSPSVTNLNEVLNKEVGTGNRLPDDILDLFNIWLVKRLPGQDYEHPTEKPASLHEKALRRCTKSGDTVLDLFAGSGSTMSACEQFNRRAFLCEVEPIFCDLIIKRFTLLTGKEPEYVS